jgi:hypothetical protein
VRDYLLALLESKQGIERLKAMQLPAGFTALDAAKLIELDKWFVEN